MSDTTSLELYKRFRPRTWEQLIGQEKIAKSLKLAVVSNKVPTAYGMFGERGCGKTSAALLLAKSINCEDPQEGNPCNRCDTCRNIDNGAQIGVNYISMANNGGADSIREIVQQAYLSSPINRQVWILDEIHNISKAAFDALLIPLEDPKMPALFILCSTEIAKIPQTIISRIQSRKFNLVDAATMTKYIRVVAKKADLDVDEDTIASAVRSGRGSVRDTLSALQGISETGEASEAYSGRLLTALAGQELGAVLGVIATATNDGVKGRELAEQLFEDLRDVYLVASGGGAELVASVSPEEAAAIAKKLGGAAGVAVVLGEIGDALTRMSMGADSRIYLEIAITKTLQKFKALRARAAARS